MDSLVNFLEASYFNRLRQSMRAELVNEFHFTSGITLLDEEFIRKLGGDGLEIDSLDEIEFMDDQTLSYKGQRVLIYIRDVHPFRNHVSMPKFHVATCKTLISMWEKKRSERYVLYQKENGVFKVNIVRHNEVNEVRQEKLDVCQNCLTCLDWYAFTSSSKASKNRIVADFSIADFFKKYPKALLSIKPKYDADTAPLNLYATNQDEINREYKRKVGYRCENPKCHIQLDGSLRRFLHVHHIDGQKHNNQEYNLKALCIKCHADQPLHDMKGLPDYKEFLSIYPSISAGQCD